MLRHSFALLHSKRWRSELLDSHVTIWQVFITVFHIFFCFDHLWSAQSVAWNTTVPLYRGVMLHVIDIWVEELLGAPAVAQTAINTVRCPATNG